MRRRLAAMFCFSMWLGLSAIRVAAADDELATALAKFGQGFSLERAPEAQRLETDVAQRLRESNQRSTAAWRSIKTIADWQAFRETMLSKLRSSLGSLPAAIQPPRVVVTGSQTGDGFIIDNLLVESAPQIWMTANLYRPLRSPKSAPGLVICHSHHAPKTHGELQDMGMTWARMGAYVLTPDLAGYGERREHGFETPADYAGEYRVGRQDYYFRYDLAIQAQLAGASLMGLYVRDLSRCADVLLEQPGIDAQRLALLGSVAGGGDPAAVAGALDERFQVVAPFNFGGPQPETRFPLPDDAEDSFAYAGSGSWEQTRNLPRSAADGFLPWAIVGSVAPRKLIYAHEFAWDRERDPVWKRLEQIYAWHDAPDRLDFTHGRGSVRGTAPESTHCTHIGAEHRRRIHTALARWFEWPDGAALEYSRRVAPESLRCWTDAAKRDLAARPLRDWLLELFDAHVERRLQQAAALSPADRAAWRRAEWERRVGSAEPPANIRPPQDLTGAVDQERRRGFERSNILFEKPDEPLRDFAIDDWQLPSDRELFVSLLMIVPRVATPLPAVVVIAPQGRGRWLAERPEQAAQVLRAGQALAIVELRGMGRGRVGDGRERTSASTAVAASELMLGEPRLAAQLRELRGVIELLRGSRSIRGDALELWADSGTPAREPRASLKSPHGVSGRPHSLNPVPALLARLACQFDDRLQTARVMGDDVDAYRAAFAQPWVYLPLEALPPEP
ncbi:MAG: hypothetical protein U0939_21085 [Pirellulales bacterium]